MDEYRSDFESCVKHLFIILKLCDELGDLPAKMKRSVDTSFVFWLQFVFASLKVNTYKLQFISVNTAHYYKFNNILPCLHSSADESVIKVQSIVNLKEGGSFW